MNDEPLTLWDSVCQTDPSKTKKVDFGRKFTAIDAYAQIKRATELWGPYGGKWGLRDVVFDVLRDVPHVDTKTKKVTLHIEASIQAVFKYPDGEFAVATDAKMTSGNDTRKKLLTDCLTKALSYLGFNADVFEGKFDDDKYVAKAKKHFEKAAKWDSLPAKEKLAQLEQGINDAAERGDADRLRKIGMELSMDARGVGDADVKKLIDLAASRVKTLEKAPEPEQPVANEDIEWGDNETKGTK